MKVLVISVRGLQAAYIGCYGNPWIATPTLDALAAQGVVFDQHFAERADAEGDRLAWRDGRYHISDRATLEPAEEGSADLIKQLREHGVTTSLILSDGRPAAAGFAAGWSEVKRAASFDAVLDAAMTALQRLARRDAWLLWVDLATLTPPWDTPEEFLAPYFQDEPDDEMEDEEDEPDEAYEDEQEPLTPLADLPPGPIGPADDVLFLRLQGSYAGAVTRLDDAVGRLLERLHALDAEDETLVVLTADHGLALGEHGAVGAANASVHEETTHVPLIMCLPGADEAGRRVAALTQAADLAPTLADVFEVELPSAQGRTLLPLVYGDVEAIRPYVCSGSRSGDDVEWSLRTPEWTFLLTPGKSDGLPPTPRLYVRPDDRREVNNVVQHYTELAEGLERTLRAFVEATRQSRPFAAPELPRVSSEPEV